MVLGLGGKARRQVAAVAWQIVHFRRYLVDFHHLIIIIIIIIIIHHRSVFIRYSSIRSTLELDFHIYPPTPRIRQHVVQLRLTAVIHYSYSYSYSNSYSAVISRGSRRPADPYRDFSSGCPKRKGFQTLHSRYSACEENALSQTLVNP